MVTVNEGSTSYHPFTLTGADGGTVTPEAIEYRLTTERGKNVIAWSDLALDATEIIVPAASNLVGADGLMRYLTIKVTHNGGETITSGTQYQLVDLKGVT